MLVMYMCISVLNDVKRIFQFWLFVLSYKDLYLLLDAVIKQYDSIMEKEKMSLIYTD